MMGRYTNLCTFTSTYFLAEKRGRSSTRVRTSGGNKAIHWHPSFRSVGGLPRAYMMLLRRRHRLDSTSNWTFPSIIICITVIIIIIIIAVKHSVVYSSSSSRLWPVFSASVLSTSSASSCCCCRCSLTARHSAIDRIMPSSWTRRPHTLTQL